MSKARFKVVAPELRTMDGHVFASKKEMLRYAELKMLQRAKQIENLELQPKFPVEINGERFCTYTADFSYTENGKAIIEELKSTGTEKDAAYRLRKKAAELFYGIKVNVITR